MAIQSDGHNHEGGDEKAYALVDPLDDLDE